jgi:hypothetical protein
MQPGLSFSPARRIGLIDLTIRPQASPAAGAAVR